MTEFVRFNAAFEHKDQESSQRTRYPAGWSGEVEAEVAKAARKAGAVPPSEKAKAEAPRPSEEIIVARKGVSVAEKAMKTAKTDEEKAKAEADLKVAQDALASLES